MYSNKKLALSIFWIVLGIVLMILALLEKIDSEFSGMGAALIVVGIMQVNKKIKYRKDAEYREQVDIEQNDERNKFIQMKAWAITGYVLVIGSAIGSVIMLIIGQELLQKVLSFAVLITIVIYYICYIIVSKKY